MALAQVLRAEGGFGVVDGGLATELEAKGATFHPLLWSATMLIDQPRMIQQVHEEYVAAGANLLITASYQATLQGFHRARQIAAPEAEQLLQESVRLAKRAAEGKKNVLVAASVANFGAHLADGSEFSGAYAQRMTIEELTAFLRPHASILHAAQPDLLAFETVSSLRETEAICALLSTELKGSLEAYVSFTCRDGEHLADGSPIAAAASRLEACTPVSAIGINCTASSLLPSLLSHLPPSRLLRIVYPNSGEHYDGESRCWRGQADALFCGPEKQLHDAVQRWHECGAHYVGGCCRTSPKHTAIIRKALSSALSHPQLK